MASDDSVLVVSPALSIPRSELQYRASRSGGPGGQHVNTSSTRIELLWDLDGSTAVTEDMRQRLRTKLGSRRNAEGQVRVVSSEHRSQLQNKSAAEKRLAELIRHALLVPKKRKATKPSRAAKARRLDEKKKRSETKRLRRADPD